MAKGTSSTGSSGAVKSGKKKTKKKVNAARGGTATLTTDAKGKVTSAVSDSVGKDSKRKSELLKLSPQELERRSALDRASKDKVSTAEFNKFANLTESQRGAQSRQLIDQSANLLATSVDPGREIQDQAAFLQNAQFGRPQGDQLSGPLLNANDPNQQPGDQQLQDVEETKNFVTKAAEFGLQIPAAVSSLITGESRQDIVEGVAQTGVGKVAGVTSAAAQAAAAVALTKGLATKVLPAGAKIGGNTIVSKGGVMQLSRFANTSKAAKLTQSLLLRKGLKAGVVATIAGAFGTYPFNGWAKQEVLGALSINTRDAINAGNFEDAENMLQMREEIQKVNWADFVPYANVIDKFREFAKADAEIIKSQRKTLEQQRGG